MSHEHTTPVPNFQSELVFELLLSQRVDPVEIASQLGVTTADAVTFESEGGTYTLDEAEPPSGEDHEAIVAQSWNWRDADDAVRSCSVMLGIRDHADDWRDYGARIRRFRRVLARAIRTVRPAAVLCRSSQQYLEPSWLLEALEEEPGEELFGFVNVRLYKVEGHDRGITAEFDETIMDTLGLGALGLTDVQCHFKHLDPSLVAEVLYNTAQYIYANGPVIETGHQLEAIGDEKWSCQLEQSIVEPLRLVVDMNPGRPYAAGSRK